MVYNVISKYLPIRRLREHLSTSDGPWKFLNLLPCFKGISKANKAIQKCLKFAKGRVSRRGGVLKRIKVRMATIFLKNQKISIGEDVDKLELLCTACRNVKWRGCYENSMTVPQNIKHGITILLTNSVSECVPQRIESRDLKRYLYMLFIITLFTNSPKGKAVQVSIHGWMDKTDYLYAVEYYSDLKREEILTCFNMGEPWRHYVK